jgi:hypothetical protein
VVEALAGLSPFQMAFVVHDLEDAARRFDALLQAAPWRVYVFDLVQPLAGASVYGLGFYIELVEPPARMPAPRSTS